MENKGTTGNKMEQAAREYADNKYPKGYTTAGNALRNEGCIHGYMEGFKNGQAHNLPSVEEVKRLESIIELKENQRVEWAEMVIKKQAKIEELIADKDCLEEMMAEYQCDYGSLRGCVEQILTMTDSDAIKELINKTVFHLCANMK